mmetsp:Transcript_55129/g.147137  ORF Transcript_55129/g.147137 Transcript_55129/m.147137 type:complete len:224 (-) Transcript_55129:126-797(-)
MTRFFMRSSVSTLMKERSQEEPVSLSRSNLHKFWARPDHSCSRSMWKWPPVVTVLPPSATQDLFVQTTTGLVCSSDDEHLCLVIDHVDANFALSHGRRVVLEQSCLRILASLAFRTSRLWRSFLLFFLVLLTVHDNDHRAIPTTGGGTRAAGRVRCSDGPRTRRARWHVALRRTSVSLGFPLMALQPPRLRNLWHDLSEARQVPAANSGMFMLIVGWDLKVEF